MLHRFIVEIETECSDRATFNRLDKLLGVYTGFGLPFTNNSVNYAPQQNEETASTDKQQPQA